MNHPIPPSAESSPGWSLSKRLLFRFAFTLFFVAAFLEWQFPIVLFQRLSLAPAEVFDVGRDPIVEFWARAFEETGYTKLLASWQDLVAWVGAHLCGPDAPVRPHPTGSGDTLVNWLGIATAAAIALLLTSIWSLVARRSRDHGFLAPWLWVAARFFVASTMFSYGFAKVIPNQFSPPHLGRLLEPLGEFSPMGLLWTFMGSSPAYTIFAGAGEVLAGLLLCFRRTATLGALVAIGVMTNVVAMNLCYDVPVKLYATVYLLTAAAIVLPDAGRLIAVLVANRPAPPRDLSKPFGSKSLNALATLLALVWIAETTRAGIESGRSRYLTSTDGRPRPALYGVHEIESFERDGVALPPLLEDGPRWRRIIIDLPNFAVVHSMTEKASAFESVIDPEARTIGLTPAAAPPRPWTIAPPPPVASAQPEPEGPKQRFTFGYEEIEPDRFRFEGEFEGARLVFVTKRRDRDDFLLTSRGFRWISEDPFNR